MSAAFDVVGIGNALVDVLSHEDDAFVEAMQLERGAMTLIDEARAHELYDAMGPGVEISGGSAANTMVGIAAFGSRAAYIGKVRDDQLGEVFRHDLRATGVHFEAPAALAGPSTGRCLIVVTPDAQRTMNTYLGVSAFLGPDDVDEALVADAEIVYLEGYLWDRDEAKDAYWKAAKVAHSAGRQVSLTLSDPFCVERHRPEWLELVAREVDVLFANEAEICSLYQCDFDDALQQARAHCRVAALTRSEKGSVIVSGDEVHVIDADPAARLVDTTGAGDLYAAGFLHGYTNGLGLATCAHLGSMAAAEVISHLGARPEADLTVLARPVLET
ncbi:MAG TPA: adenosine kinase [Acidimicrobiia bacterium]|nr:adenosine kinase [Acidimicrobiia bacterium]